MSSILTGSGPFSRTSAVCPNSQLKGRTMRHSIGGLAASVAFVIVMTGGAVAQTEGPGRALVASNVLRLSADTLRSGFSAKDFIVPHAGVVRVRYTFKSDGTGSVSVSVSSA